MEFLRKGGLVFALEGITDLEFSLYTVMLVVFELAATGLSYLFRR
jgi:hypothetical protein